MNKTQVFEVARVDSKTLLITRTFSAPRDKVFEAWTVADHVKHWWDPTGKPLRKCEIDLKPGGRFHWVHSGPEGRTFAGSYTTIHAPTRLEFKVDGLPSPEGSSAALEFRETEGGTMLKMLMTFASKKDCDAILQMRVDANTGKTLANLEDYLAAQHGRATRNT